MLSQKLLLKIDVLQQKLYHYNRLVMILDNVSMILSSVALHLCNRHLQIDTYRIRSKSAAESLKHQCISGYVDTPGAHRIKSVLHAKRPRIVLSVNVSGL